MAANFNFVHMQHKQPIRAPHSIQKHTTISFNEASIEDGSCINSNEQTTTTIGERIKCGESLIQLENLATSDECKLLC